MPTFIRNIINNTRGDRVIWAVVFILSIFSLLAVYSSTGTLAYKYQGGNTEYYLFKHLIILLMGLFLIYITHLIKFTYFSRIFQIALYIAIPLLVITLFAGLNLNEARRALQLPFNLTFQTSDLAKLTLILYLARVLSHKGLDIKNFKTAALHLYLPSLIICALIFPANFSTAAILFSISILLMYIGGVRTKHILSFTGITALLLVLAVLTGLAFPKVLPRTETWTNRIAIFFDAGEAGKEDAYQVEQSKIAIASGGIFGKAPGNSTQRNFLPHPYSDFIFAIIVEEYGLAGGAFMVLMFLILFFRVVRITARSPRNFGALMVFGVGFSLVFQAMINMAVAVNLLPVTGQPLPLVSMGGTSIWFTSISIGIILSVSKETEKKEANEQQPATA
ncbi:MAG: FtsW/RodA/SpoVE family cell cycle protein [Bacteroidales bacterium]